MAQRFIDDGEVDLQEVIADATVVAEYFEYFPQFHKAIVDYIEEDSEGDFDPDIMLNHELRNTEFVKKIGVKCLEKFVGKIDFNSTNEEELLENVTKAELIFVYLDKQISINNNDLESYHKKFKSYFQAFQNKYKKISLGNLLWGSTTKDLATYDELENLLTLNTIFGNGEDEIREAFNPIYNASLQSRKFKTNTIIDSSIVMRMFSKKNI